MRKKLYIICWIANFLLLFELFFGRLFPAINELIGVGSSFDLAFYIIGVPAMFLTGLNYFIINRHKEYWLNILILFFCPIFNILFLWKVLQNRWI